MTLANRLAVVLPLLLKVPRVLVAVLRSKMAGGGEADAVLRYLLAERVNAGSPAHALPERPAEGRCKLFGWELSYFTGKVRAYLRYKARHSSLEFDEVVADPTVVADILVPSTGSVLVPQLQLPDGRFIQDSTEIIDVVEELWPAAWPARPVLPPTSLPRQRIVCHIIELLADEWLLVPAFHWRWAYSGDGAAQRMPAFMGGASQLPNHREYNLGQWGAFLRPDGSVKEQVRAARFLFDHFFLSGFGAIKGAMVALGVTDDTVAAWEASCRNILALFEAHLKQHPFVLGSRPSTADFALLGPIWAHLIKDPVPGAMLHKEYPRVTAWATRLHESGGAVCETDPREEGDWLPDDEVPATVLPIMEVFAKEMWPVLTSSCNVLREYLRGSAVQQLPGKSFAPTGPDQIGHGPLTHSFSLPFDRQGRPGGESRGTRMVVPYQVWMLQRLEAAVVAAPRDHVAALPGGEELLGLPQVLRGCRVRKDRRFLIPDCVAPHSKL